MRKTIASALLAVALLAGCGTNGDDSPGSRLTPEPFPTATETASQEPVEQEAAPAPTEEPQAPVEPTEPPAPDTPVADSGTAQSVLSSLAVKGRAPKTGYDRDQFGGSWPDVDHNGCDTRNDILRRDLDSITTEPNGCIVLTGTLNDDFSGQAIYFDRSTGNGGGVDIDHLVALSNAWQTGAQQLSSDQRVAFANDPLNLLAVEAGLNRQKGDGDAATWLPPNNAFRCDYVSSQIAVKAKYGLWVTQPEKDAMSRVLSNCPNHPLPNDDGSVVVPDYAPAPSPEPAPPASSSGGGTSGNTGLDPNFGTCKEAKANGYGPYIKGVDPEYDFYRDGDGDGEVCE